MRQTFVQRQDRHQRGWGGRTHTLHVPLLSTGELHRGFFRVPREAITFKEHTNQIHTYNQYVDEKVREWVDWKRRSGWVMRGKPRVLVPIDGPTERTGGDPIDDGDMRVYVEATFMRETPLQMPIDLFLHKRDEAKRYQVDLEQTLVETPLPEPKKHFVETTRASDPMKEAEERRDQLGIRRELVVEDGEVTGANVIYETLEQGDSNQTVTGDSHG